jgi:hypothetical protein
MMLSLACDHRTIDGATELNFTNIETIYRKPSYHACVYGYHNTIPSC